MFWKLWLLATSLYLIHWLVFNFLISLLWFDFLTRDNINRYFTNLLISWGVTDPLPDLINSPNALLEYSNHSKGTDIVSRWEARWQSQVQHISTGSSSMDVFVRKEDEAKSITSLSSSWRSSSSFNRLSLHTLIDSKQVEDLGLPQSEIITYHWV